MNILSSQKKLIFSLVAIVGVITFAFWLADIARENEAVQEFVSRFGYIGIFIISLISGFNLIVPVPAAAFLPIFIASGQNVWVAIFIITLGMTVADSIAYLIGKAGKYAVEQKSERVIKFFDELSEKYTLAPFIVMLLYAAFIPFPNEILLIPLGFIGYKYRYILPALLIGNFFFNVILASGIVGLYLFA